MRIAAAEPEMLMVSCAVVGATASGLAGPPGDEGFVAGLKAVRSTL